MWKKLTLAVYDNTLTIPRGFDTCHKVESCGGSFPLYSQFHRFAGYGLSCDSVYPIHYCAGGLKLIDENAQTFRIPTGTFTLRAVATEISAEGLTFIGGFDQNSAELFGDITLALVNGTANGSQQYTQLPQIQKAVTTNAVSLYAVDTTTAVATLIAVFAPGETIPVYRKYAIAGACSSTTDTPLVSAICKLSFVPAISANDIVVPSHIGALRLGLMAHRFEERVDPVNGQLYWGPNHPEQTGKMYGAVDLLDSELREIQAAEQPIFNVSPDFACGGIRNVL